MSERDGRQSPIARLSLGALWHYLLSLKRRFALHPSMMMLMMRRDDTRIIRELIKSNLLKQHYLPLPPPFLRIRPHLPSPVLPGPRLFLFSFALLGISLRYCSLWNILRPTRHRSQCHPAQRVTIYHRHIFYFIFHYSVLALKPIIKRLPKTQPLCQVQQFQTHKYAINKNYRVLEPTC